KKRRPRRVDWTVSKSRKKFRMDRRAPVRDSKRCYHAATMKVCKRGNFPLAADAAPIGRVAQTPLELLDEEGEEAADAEVGETASLETYFDGVSEGAAALTCANEARIALPENVGASLISRDAQAHGKPVVIDLTSGDEEQAVSAIRQSECFSTEVVQWPRGVTPSSKLSNPTNIRFRDIGATDWCGCTSTCERESCDNAFTEIYCTSRNCRVGSKCGNRLVDFGGIELRKGCAGYGIVATSFIPEGAIVGEYTGVLTTHDFEKDDERTSDYALGLATTDVKGRKVYIDAKTQGGLTRFINHSCDADAGFFEMQYRRQTRVAVIALRDIPVGKEITVDYNDIWFECVCKSPECRNPAKPTQPEVIEIE
ncbi:hypothetical protein F441_16481, partial [Phytophthora nicotianae CJ01A1]